MAKFQLYYKSEHVYDSINEAKSDVPAGEVERLCDLFDIGEELLLEFDTETNSCVVVPWKSTQNTPEHYEKLNKQWQEKKDSEAAEIAAYDAAMEESEANLPTLTSPVLPAVNWYAPIKFPPTPDKALYEGEQVIHMKMSPRRDDTNTVYYGVHDNE